MTIGEVSRRTGVSVQAIRYYERRGLLGAPARRPSGYRTFPPGVIREVRLIRWAQHLGFRLGEMTEMMHLVRSRRRVPSRAFCRKAEAKIHEIDETIRELTVRKRSLALLVQCRCRGDCPIVTKAIGEKGTR